MFFPGTSDVIFMRPLPPWPDAGKLCPWNALGWLIIMSITNPSHLPVFCDWSIQTGCPIETPSYLRAKEPKGDPLSQNSTPSGRNRTTNLWYSGTSQNHNLIAVSREWDNVRTVNCRGWERGKGKNLCKEERAGNTWAAAGQISRSHCKNITMWSYCWVRRL